MEHGKTYKADYEVLETIMEIQNQRDAILHYARWLEQQLRYTAEAAGDTPEGVEIDEVLRQERAERGVTQIMEATS